MNRWLRGLGLLLTISLTIALGYGGWWLLLDGRPPAQRPDLERLPVAVPPPAPGYPTLNALYLGYFLGWIDAANINEEHPPPEGVRVEKDLVYDKVGERVLMLDLYSPSATPAKPAPVLLFIHGGGWSGGDKQDYAIYCNKFAGLGYVVASIGYRFSQEALFPAALQDVNAAIVWLHGQAASRGGDPGRMAVIGGSAGGHLSLMAAYAWDKAEFHRLAPQEIQPSPVRAVVDLYGPTDLTQPVAQDASQVTRFLGKQYVDAPEIFALASPITHLDATDPPTLIIQGTLDNVVPPEQSDLLAERLRSLGVSYWYSRIDGWPHTLDIVWDNFEHTSALIHEFLKAHGLGA